MAETNTERAIFAGGCFWCTESLFDGLEGVISADPGYIGGEVEDPSYEQVSSGATGHTEAVVVTFNPERVGYPQLLERFWLNIDPTDAGGQFADRGSQYRTAIFYVNDAQKQLAEASKQEVEQRLGQKVATAVEPATTFYVAEDYHHDYAERNSLRYKMYYYGSGRPQRLEQLCGDTTAETKGGSAP